MATLEERLGEALKLLKRSAGYANAFPSIGGHKLSVEIAEFRGKVLNEFAHLGEHEEEEPHV